ncbi:MAG: response regulator, partial [Bacteroidetes bacterium]
VDDSITTRMLMKNIMESAGYVVTTAVDGEDGLAAFEREPFDLVVTDVEMPRRSGIELTRAIRAHPERGTVPVILVTSLASDADRARGIEAGADAYFVKSDFDQAHLLDVVDQLI